MENFKGLMFCNTSIPIIAPLIAGLLWACGTGYGTPLEDPPSATKPSILAPELTTIFGRFVAEKRALAEKIAREHQLAVPPAVRDFFLAAQRDDWTAASNRFDELLAGNYTPGHQWLPPPFWGAIHETFGTYELLEAWTPKFLIEFGTNTVGGIPAGGIYFGGSAAGRFLVSLFSQSHSEGRPFLTLTQNALSDPAYGAYLREMYGQRINVPSTNDVQKFVDEYSRDAKARLDHDEKFPTEPPRIKRGEDVRNVAGIVQVNGPVAVMAIHALIMREIFEKNPERPFFMEESYPVEWTYPRLTPHQFVFKINREIFPEIPAAAIRADREFWTQKIDSWLGPWLTTNTSVKEISEFDGKTYLTAERKDFRGDREFVGDLEAREAFSHFRACIAGLYWWRAIHAKNAADRQRMTTEADFAFRQAFAICPSSDEVRIRYSELLAAGGRSSEAWIVAETARILESKKSQIQQPLEPSSGTNKTQPSAPIK